MAGRWWGAQAFDLKIADFTQSVERSLDAIQTKVNSAASQSKEIEKQASRGQPVLSQLAGDRVDPRSESQTKRLYSANAHELSTQITLASLKSRSLGAISVCAYTSCEPWCRRTHRQTYLRVSSLAR